VATKPYIHKEGFQPSSAKGFMPFRARHNQAGAAALALGVAGPVRAACMSCSFLKL
jgi:hypothetical protein